MNIVYYWKQVKIKKVITKFAGFPNAHSYLDSEKKNCHSSILML